MFLLHGIGGNRGQWAAQVEALSSEFATFAWDARGYGDSHGPQVTSMRDFAEDLMRVLDRLELDRVIAVGHSMGGRILMEACALMPDRLGAIVLSGAQAGFLAHLNETQRRDYVAIREGIFTGNEVLPEAARRVARQVLPQDVTDAVIAQLVSDFSRLDREGYLAALNASAGWEQSDILSGLKMPVAVMGGALDTVCPPAECHRIAGLLGQGPATILDGVGHMPQIEALTTVTECLFDFIRDHAHLASQIDTQTLAGETA